MGRNARFMHRHRFDLAHWSESFCGRVGDAPEGKRMASSLFLLRISPEDIRYFPQGLTKGIRARIWDFFLLQSNHVIDAKYPHS